MKSITRAYHQDARAQSAEATGRRIVEAFLARLMKQWFDEITLDCVAGDAGVTVQTVVRRFGGKEGLLAEAIKIFASQVNAKRGAASDNLELLVDNLIADYEETGDAVLRLLALEPRHPALRKYLDFGRSEHRQWVSGALAGPLSELNGAARTRAVDALVIATDVYTWKLLRRDMARSVPATAQTMKRIIEATISEFLKNNKPETNHA